MKKLLFGAITLAAIAASFLFGQDITGTWQGTLHLAPGRDLRTVVKISKADTGGLKATFYSIDQGGQGIPVGSITVQGSAVKFAIPAIGGTYEGKLSNTDATSITGMWTQGPTPLALDLTLANDKTAWAIPDPPPPPTIMPATAKPQFDVATIKPSQSADGFGFNVNRSGMLITHNTTLKDLIKISYGLHPRQITNGPSWFETDKYDITAKPDTAGVPSIAQLMSMTQKLIADRFQLKFHKEKKELSVYALTIAKLGVKITEDTSNPKGLPGFGGGGPRGLNVRNATMSEFCDFLQANALDQPVVDQTGLGSKRYNFVLKWTPDGPPAVGGLRPEGAAAEGLEAPPDIYLAVQQQLGLKLESTKAPVDVVVIDHVEKPSDN